MPKDDGNPLNFQLTVTQRSVILHEGAEIYQIKTKIFSVNPGNRALPNLRFIASKKLIKKVPGRPRSRHLTTFLNHTQSGQLPATLQRSFAGKHRGGTRVP